MSFLYSEEELQRRIERAAGCRDGVKVKHMPDHAGFHVQIGQFTMTLPYAQATSPDPALAKGWRLEVTERGQVWYKGDLIVAAPNNTPVEYTALPWVFGKERGGWNPNFAWQVRGRTADRDVAMAAAEALP